MHRFHQSGEIILELIYEANFATIPSMLNNEVYRKQHIKRLVDVVINASKDEIAPDEHMERIIQSAIQLRNPFIKDGDPFVVLGNDGLDGSWFPTGSFQTQEEALVHVRKHQDEEYICSDGKGISTTFHAFTRDGAHVREKSSNE